jgi:hypothetical protein
MLALAAAGARLQAMAAAALIALALAAAAPAARAADEAAAARLQVTDPYVELHTGPGRGYPVFHVVPRGEAVVIVLRHTDWFKVRTDKGLEGWARRAQLETTLIQAGAGATLRDALAGDGLTRRVELGAAWGRFDGEPALKAWTNVRLAETISVEGTVGQVQGLYSGTGYWQLNLHLEPWAGERIAPHFGLGFGRFSNLPNASLVGALPTDANLANAMVGVRWQWSERFVLRADYALTTAYIADRRSGEYQSLTLGLSFFF